MVQTANDLLAQKRCELEEEKSKNIKRRKRFNIVTLIFLIAAFLVFFLLYLWESSYLESRYQSYVEAFESDIDLFNKLSSDKDLIQYKDSYKYFEKLYLGNTNNNTIMYGKYYSNTSNTLLSIDGKLYSYTASGKNILYNTPVSYINCNLDQIYFRNDTNKNVYQCKLDGTDIKVIIQDKAGEVLYYNGILYYINLTDKRALYSKDTLSGTSMKIIEDSIVSFVILGNSIYYLNRSNDLKSYEIEKGTIQKIQSNIDSFTIKDKIIAKNNDKILSFTINNNKPSIILEGVTSLIGADDAYYFYINNENKLMAHNLDEKKAYILQDNCTICRGVYRNIDNNFIIITGSVDGNGKYKEKNFILDINEVTIN